MEVRSVKIPKELMLISQVSDLNKLLAARLRPFDIYACNGMEFSIEFVLTPPSNTACHKNRNIDFQNNGECETE